MHYYLALILLFLQAVPAWAEANPKLVVLHKAEASALLIDLESGKEMQKWLTGNGPHEAEVSPDGRWLVISNYGQRKEPGSTLSIIDLTRPEKEPRLILLDEASKPHGMVFDAQNGSLWVTIEGKEAIAEVDIEPGQIKQVIKTNARISHMLTTCKDRPYVFVANIGSDSVSVIDRENKQLITEIPTGTGAEGIDCNSDGSELWVTNRGEDTISILDTHSFEIIDTLASPEFPIRLKFSPDGSRVLVSNAKSTDVSLFDATAKTLLGKISMPPLPVKEGDDRLFSKSFSKGSVPIGIRFHPSGERAYVANANADKVVEVNLKSMKIERVFPVGKEPDGLAIIDE